MTDPDQRTADTPPLGATGRQRILVEWNQTARDYPRDKCVHQLFEEQVERTPEAVAVVFEGQSLTYRELNARANRLAHHLRSLGVGPDVLVGLCVERSLDMPVALLGILKAGGAYVPLDPDLPRERLAFLLRDMQTHLVLAQGQGRANLPAPDAAMGPQVLVLDDLPELLAGTDRSNPPCLNTPDHLAYVMYTSGSTGRPKGVMVPHLGVVRLVIKPDYVALTPQDVMLQFAPLSFDASTFEIWGALLNGARLVLPPSRPLDYAELGSQIESHGVTTLWLTAALFHEMLEHAPTALARVRQLLAGGDVLAPSKARQYLELPGHGRLINGYGPTENTTFTCCGGFDRAEQIGDAVSIGRPISGTKVYILDPQGIPIPVGIAGEIYTGGDGLARGYLNAPEMTAEKFIADPFNPAPGARLYKTGDLARYLPDGNIEFIGRLDNQVKIRGHRVELGEIEAVLGGHPTVGSCAVVARGDAGHDRVLTAFLVSRGSANLVVGSLRRWLEERLPDYTIPAQFIRVAALPLATNGKVDRRALEQPVGVELASDTEYVGPRDQRERELVDIWQAVLRRERVGVRDDFFEFGGHSLLAAALCAQIRARLNVDVPLRWVLEQRTIESLAERMASPHGLPESTYPIEKADRNRPLPMSLAQQGMWLLNATLPEPVAYNQPVAWQLSGRVDRERVQRALRVILDRHEVLRTALAREGEALVQRVSPATEVPLPWQEVNLHTVPPAERQSALEECLLKEARRPFDLAQAPLWRVGWIKLAEDEHALAFTFHHAIVDEWSQRSFFRELELLYAADGQPSPAALPELPMQYADYAAWQRQRLSEERLEQQRGYWREQLRDLPPDLALPADRARPARPSGRGGSCDFQVEGPMVTRLRKLAREEGTTLFTVLLAAFQVWLHRYTGKTDLVVGTPLADREQPEVQSMMGFFLNTLPIRLRLDGSPSFRKVLRQAREVLLGAFSNADLPFEQMVEIAVKERTTRHQPLYQAMFAFLEEGLSPIHLGHAHARPLRVETGTSKNDLILNVDALGETLDCRFEYSSDLFTAETAARMSRHLTELLQSITDQPEISISQLNLMSEAERHQVLVEWNQTARDYPRDKCVHQLFEEQVERTPDGVAVVFAGQSLTYRELNTLADDLARHLRRLGIRRQTPVAVCLDRSAQLIISLLAILRSGGAYVPIDPANPAARVGFMLEQTQAPLVLTATPWRARFAQHGVQVFCPGDKPAELLPENTEPLGSQGSATDLAYVIYTSGSTGQPKGVAVSHRAINRLVLDADYLQLGPGDRVAHVSNVAFDAATFEIWGALLNGAQLVGIESDVVLSPKELGGALRAHAISSMFLTTALFNQIARQVPATFATLRDLLFGGEAVDLPSVRAVLQHGPPQRLLHVYGPTEVTTFSTWHQVEASDQAAVTVPIGRPIANTIAHVLDTHLQLTPIGVPGELFLGGDGVAIGYLSQPDLTAERFIPDPFRPETGFNDYYHAVASAYRVQKYPGTAHIIVSDEAPRIWKWFWRYMVRGGVSFHPVPGKHLQLLSSDYLPGLAQTLGALLDRAQKG